MEERVRNDERNSFFENAACGVGIVVHPLVLGLYGFGHHDSEIRQGTLTAMERGRLTGRRGQVGRKRIRAARKEARSRHAKTGNMIVSSSSQPCLSCGAPSAVA